MNELESYIIPWFGIVLTVIAYSIAHKMNRRWSWIHPLLISSSSVIAFLMLVKIPYDTYMIGARWIGYLLGPATVALGVPLYQYRQVIRQQVKAIFPAMILGSLAGIFSVIVLAGIVGGSKEIMLSLMPKSVTSPISIAIAQSLGALPELTAVFTVLTGLVGSMIGTVVLKAIGVTSDFEIGTAIGTAAHGIGTAKLIRDSTHIGSISSFAMACTGILVSILFIPFYLFFAK